jgi:hypothetical protein
VEAGVQIDRIGDLVGEVGDRLASGYFRHLEAAQHQLADRAGREDALGRHDIAVADRGAFARDREQVQVVPVEEEFRERIIL